MCSAPSPPVFCQHPQKQTELVSVQLGHPLTRFPIPRPLSPSLSLPLFPEPCSVLLALPAPHPSEEGWGKIMSGGLCVQTHKHVCAG